MVKEPETLEAFLTEVDQAAGADRHLDGAIARLRNNLGALSDPEIAQMCARRLVESMALILQASLLVRHSHPAVADAFCRSRLGGDWGSSFGTLPAGLGLATIIKRATAKETA
ncbi:hypothetical protein [Streptomyces sp. NPDC127084]|uniref:hypothetical protein n=1 Tax=Streptomyces sp. NPDC127084 TaxID=3347133 RepID=UPI00365224A7